MEDLQKEFIPYDRALRMKALGFDEPCFGKYLSSLQSDWKEFELILEMGMNEEFEDNRNIYLLEEACSAPTFSQAFRWFREKYKLHSTITSISQESWQWHITKPGESLGKLYDEDFYTYEEAELACLKKLIEIVKKIK